MINPNVLETMFTTPIEVFPTSPRDAYGDRTESFPYTLYGYVYDEQVVVVNDLGEETVSKRQVYLPLDKIEKVHETYLVSCLNSPKVPIIKKQVFRGRHSTVLIGVLYLP